MANKIGTLYYDIDGNDKLKKILAEDKKMALELQKVLKDTNAQMGKMDLRQLKQYNSLLTKQQKDTISLEAAKKKADDASILRQQKLQTEIARTEAAQKRAALVGTQGQQSLNRSVGISNKTMFSQNNLLNQLSQAAGIYFSIYQAGAFIKSLYVVSGEFEKQKISLAAILRDSSQAGILFERIKDLAVKSPFQFGELVSYTKQLSAFSVPYNELYDTTKRLADLSAGLGVDMSRLVLAFGQVRSASVLRGQELRQFTEAGIPLIDELAKKFTKLTGEATSAGDVFDKISRREVSFQMVKDIFTDLTSEGGKFYMMQEKQAESLAGKIANMKDSYQLMLNSIGEGNSGIMKDSIELLTSMMSNWESISKVLKVLVATYGTYRAVLITVNTLQKASLAIEGSKRIVALINLIRLSKGLTAATYGQVVAQRALNAAMSINIIYAAAVAISALVGALVLFNKETKTTAELQTELYNKIAQQQQATENLNESVKSYLSTAADLKKSDVDRQKALDNLQKLMPSVFKNLSLEKLAVLGVTDAYKLYSKEVNNTARIGAKTNYIMSLQRLIRLENELSAKIEKGEGGTLVLQDKIAQERAMLAIYKEQFSEQTRLANAQSEFNKKQSKWREEVDLMSKGATADIGYREDESYSDYISRIQDELEKATSANKKYKKENPFAKDEIDANNKQIQAYTKVLNKLGGTIKGLDGEDPIYKKVKQQIDIIDKAKDAYDAYLKVMSSSKASELVKKETGIDFSNESAIEKINALNTRGMLPKNVLETSNRVAELTIKYNKESTVDSFKDATDAIIRYVEDNKGKFNLYKKILGESGNKTLAINLAFGTDKLNFSSYAELLKSKIQEALKSVGENKLTNVDDLLGLSPELFESLPDSIKKLVQSYKDAQDEMKTSSSGTVFELIKNHQNMVDAINAANVKANYDIEAIEIQRKNIGDEIANKTIAQRKKDLDTEIANIRFNEFKKSALWKSTFDDLKNVSSQTLGEIISKLEESSETMGSSLGVEEFKELMGKLNDVKNELIERDPFLYLSERSKSLADAEKRVQEYTERLNKVRNGEKIVVDTQINSEGKIVALYLTEEQALADLAKAKRKHNKDNASHIKAQKEALAEVEKLSSSLKDVGNAIGGAAGSAISLMGDIGTFASTTSEGIIKVADTSATAIGAIEKASVILAIISEAIQLMQKLDELLPSAYKSYENYADKIKAINLVTSAVLDYQVAVMKATQAENTWFSEDSLREMKDLYDLRLKIDEYYFSKLNELQATYQNESGSGWAKYLIPSVAIYDVLTNTYSKGLSKAIDNLRIETRKKSKGLFGSGIGGKSQKTEDLRTWVKRELGFDLFDESGWLNETAYDVIMDKYSDKLVGETKDTLEQLKELKDQHDEYLEKLQEYVDSLYSPLVDNMTSALWDWLDNGKNALDSFKDYASDTFRDIVTDMMKTIILKNVVGNFSEDIASLYDQYNAGKLTESQLMAEVTKRTQSLIGGYEQQLPALQAMIQTLTSSLSGIGVNMDKASSASSGITASAKSLTEETGNILASYINAMRSDLSVIRSILDGSNSKGIYGQVYAIMQAYYPTIVNTLALQQAELVKIQNNTLRSANNSDGILTAIEELRSRFKQVTTYGSSVKMNV